MDDRELFSAPQAMFSAEVIYRAVEGGKLLQRIQELERRVAILEYVVSEELLCGLCRADEAAAEDYR